MSALVKFTRGESMLLNLRAGTAKAVAHSGATARYNRSRTQLGVAYLTASVKHLLTTAMSSDVGRNGALLA